MAGSVVTLPGRDLGARGGPPERVLQLGVEHLVQLMAQLVGSGWAEVSQRAGDLTEGTASRGPAPSSGTGAICAMGRP